MITRSGRTLRTSHRWFLDRSPKTKQISDGVCFGIGWQATKAILGRNLDEFDKTMTFIHNIPLTSYRQSTVERKWGPYHWTYIEEFIRQTHDYQDTYSIPLILRKLGTISLVKIFSGIYSTQELCNYLNAISSHLSQNKSLRNKPLSLILSDTNHAICITYDANESKWIFIDSNKLPSIRNQSPLEIAEKIEKALSVPTKAMFSTIMLCNKLDEIYFKEFVTTLFEQPMWKEIHRFNSEKMQVRDINGSSLLHLAAHFNDIDTALYLMQNNFDSTLVDKWNYTAFAVAEEEGHNEIVDIIMEHSNFACEFLLNYCASFFKPLININVKRKRDEIDSSEGRETKRMKLTEKDETLPSFLHLQD